MEIGGKSMITAVGDDQVGRTTGRALADLALGVVLMALLTGGVAPVFGDEKVAQPWQLDLIASNPAVGEEVVAALEAEGTARVIATFDVRSRHSGRRYGRFASAAARTALGEVSDEILAGVPQDSFRTRYRYQAVNALAGAIDADGVLALLDHPAVRAIDVDRPTRALLKEAIPLARIDRVKKMTTVEGKKLRGKGVTVAVIDGGADHQHPDLQGRVKDGQCFCRGFCCPDGSDAQSGKSAIVDTRGHGTHVTGIIASKGRVAPKGIAPKAKIVAIKTLHEGGRGFVSDSVRALDWIITDRPDVDLVNMSLGSDDLYHGRCDKKGANNEAYATAVNTLWERGVVVFAASGNNGHHKKMTSPACIDRVVSVGSTYDESFLGYLFPYVEAGCEDVDPLADQVTCSANTGKRTDLLAPGCEIVSSAPGEAAVVRCGTSMASPMAAGCATLLKQAFPKATPALLESALLSSSTIVTDPKNDRGYPALDCEEAFEFLDGSIASASVLAAVPDPPDPSDPGAPELRPAERPGPGPAGIDPSSPLRDTVERERPRRRKE